MNKYIKEDLEKLILIDKKSYEEIGRKYKVSGSAIKNAAKRLDIKLEPRRKINKKEKFKKLIQNYGYCLNCNKKFIKYNTKKNKYCSQKCQQDYQHKKAYKLFLKGNPDIQRSNYDCVIFKKDILKEQNNKCAICGCENKWGNKELIFVLDHIDGDASHNIRENLRLVCPNCDSQLPTYKSKNKKSSRNYRYNK